MYDFDFGYIFSRYILLVDTLMSNQGKTIFVLMVQSINKMSEHI